MRRKTKRFVALVIAVALLVLVAYVMRAEIQGLVSKVGTSDNGDGGNKGKNSTPDVVHSSNTTVSFIDVWQGDSALIQTGDNKSFLIDAGPENRSASVIHYLQAKNVTTLDALVITHPDADHIGGANEVLESFVVKAVYHPGLAKDTAAYTNFITAAEAEGCPIYNDTTVHVGDMLNLSADVTFQVLNIDSHASDANDASIVLKMVDGSVGFMFTGDASTDVEERIISYHYNISAQILKVGHHGSATSTGDAWLDAVDPSVGVISVGAGNTYGHPTQACLDRLSAHAVTVYRTDTNGTVEVTTNGISYDVSCER